MKSPITEIDKEHSQRIFWIIQTIFGYLIGRSFHSYASIFVPSFSSDVTTLTFAFIAVYALIIWSWIDFSFTLIVAPYRFKGTFEIIRFIVDLLIVLSYSYLLVFLDYIKDQPHEKITAFFAAHALVYVGYLVSGLLRMKQYGSRASRVSLILVFVGLFVGSTVLYEILHQRYPTEITNRLFILLTFLLSTSYRLVRSILRRRKYRIGVDLDGVLANQIDGILPVVKKELNIDLRYDDIVRWDLRIGETRIDEIIIKEQRHRNYIIGMPAHPGSRVAIKKLIKKHYIAIATARPPESDPWSKEWLLMQQISFDDFFNFKEGLKHNEDFDILIDDHIVNALAFLEKHTGCVVLFSQPWNQDRKILEGYIESGRLAVAENWSEIPRLVRGLLHSR